MQLTISTDDLVDAAPPDASHARSIFDDRRQLGRSRKWNKVFADKVFAGRIGRQLRHLPSRLHQKRAGCGIDIVCPGREQPNMTPVADARARLGAGFVDLHGKTTADEVGGGGKADRTGTDNRNRKLHHHCLSYYSRRMELVGK